MTRQDTALPAGDPAAIGQVLASCSHLLAWCGAHAGPAYHQAVPVLTRAAGRERSAGELYYDVTLAAGLLAEENR